MLHIPVLVREVIEYLNPQSNENFVDGTLGAAGHALAILEKTSPDGRLIGFDWDNESLERTKKNVFENQPDLAERIIFINDSYSNLKENVQRQNIASIDGILIDLGLSSDQLEESGRGFSFKKDEILDMRYSLRSDLTAKDIVNSWDGREIERIIREFGEERWARKISEKIISQRKIKSILTTGELLEVIALAIPKKFQYARTHFAARTFQALRIAVNNELGNLEKFLPESFDVLASGGRLAIISFHSLEDRMVKNFFRDLAKSNQAQILTKKPVVAGEEEIINNPRCRSAKLRVLKKA